MIQKQRPITVIALGGSIIAPDTIDIDYLKRFRAFLIPYLKRGRKFALIVGGGAVCRDYQRAAGQVHTLTDEDLDVLGTHVTQLNGHLVRAVFSDYAHPSKQEHFGTLPSKRDLQRYALFVGAGRLPGRSTDYEAFVLAQKLGVSEVLIATKAPSVYDKDFNEHRDAKPFSELTWKQYRALIGKKWTPGMKAPVDPVAAQFAQKHKMSAQLILGTNLENFQRYLAGKPRDGTVIRP
jgi:uridylate kinase